MDPCAKARRRASVDGSTQPAAGSSLHHCRNAAIALQTCRRRQACRAPSRTGSLAPGGEAPPPPSSGATRASREPPPAAARRDGAGDRRGGGARVSRPGRPAGDERGPKTPVKPFLCWSLFFYGFGKNPRTPNTLSKLLELLWLRSIPTYKIEWFLTMVSTK